MGCLCAQLYMVAYPKNLLPKLTQGTISPVLYSTCSTDIRGKAHTLFAWEPHPFVYVEQSTNDTGDMSPGLISPEMVNSLGWSHHTRGIVWCQVLTRGVGPIHFCLYIRHMVPLVWQHINSPSQEKHFHGSLHSRFKTPLVVVTNQIICYEYDWGQNKVNKSSALKIFYPLVSPNTKARVCIKLKPIVWKTKKN